MADSPRLESNLCWEIAVIQQCKHGETVCGDQVIVHQDGDRVQLVLSDGLGSGIQANIASTLTAKLIDGLYRNDFSLADCLRAVEAALPVTKRHNLAYATFNLVTTVGREIRLVQYDSPQAVFFRDGLSLDYPYKLRTLGEKTLQESVLTMKSGDMLILFSDGVSEAGRGVTTYAGWERREMEDYLFRSIQPDDHASRVAASIVSTVQMLDLFEYHDDTSVAVLRLRQRLAVNLLIGPDDAWRPENTLLDRFFAMEGKYALCGTGAVQAAAGYLGRPLRVLRQTASGQLPPVSALEGVDLAVDGELTFREMLGQLERYRQLRMLSLDARQERDGASMLTDLLAEEASEVNILFCAASGSSSRERPEQVLRLRELLTELGKRVSLSFQ